MKIATAAVVFLFSFLFLFHHLFVHADIHAGRDASMFGVNADSSRQANLRADFVTFYYAGKAVARNGNMYDAKYLDSLAARDKVANHIAPYLYPPFLAIVAQPLGMLPNVSAQHIWDYAQIAVLSVISVLVFLTAGDSIEGQVRLWLTAALVCVAVVVLPFTSNVDWGQINFLVLLFIALSFYFYFTEKSDWLAGMFLSLAVLIKVTPALFLIFFVVNKRWRAVYGFFAGLLVFVLATFDLASWRQFFVFLPNMGYARNVEGGFHPSILANISLAGFYMRAFVAEPKVVRLLTLCTVVVLFAILLYNHLKAQNAGNKISFLLPYSVLMVVASPIAWRHHLIYLFPGVVFGLANVMKGRGQQTMFFLLSGTIVLASFDFQPMYQAIAFPEEIRPYATSMNLFFLLVLFFLGVRTAPRDSSLLVKT